MRTRLADRERPFSVIGAMPCEIGLEGFNSHNVAGAFLPLRITVRFQNGRLLRGRDAEGFEKFEPGLKAKGK